MRKHPLVVLLGSGATVPAIPGVSEITRVLRDWRYLRGPGRELARRGTDLFPLADDARPPLFEFLSREYEVGGARSPNFEELIHVLELLDSLYPLPPLPGVAGPLLGPWVTPRSDVNLAHSFGAAAADACQMILNVFADACDAIEANRVRSPSLVSALRELSADFDLKILSLNYDDVPEMSGLRLFTGYDGTHEYAFDPRAVMALPDGHWHFQLHGSVRFGNADLGRLVVPRHHDRATARSMRTSRRSRDRMQDGHSAAPLPMITGMRKADKALAEPYASYYVALRRALFETSRWLIVGYGGGDKHVNDALRAAHDFQGQTGIERRRMVVGFEPQPGPVYLHDDPVPEDQVDRILAWAPEDVRRFRDVQSLPMLEREAVNSVSDSLAVSLDGTAWALETGLPQINAFLMS